jgi:hypothetical protein
MKQKIIYIQDCDTATEMVLTTDIGEMGEVLVVLTAWHDIDDNWQIQQETLTMLSHVMAERFISDFSDESASVFANEYQP